MKIWDDLKKALFPTETKGGFYKDVARILGQPQLKPIPVRVARRPETRRS